MRENDREDKGAARELGLKSIVNFVTLCLLDGKTAGVVTVVQAVFIRQR